MRYQIFEYDTKFERDKFDISECFKEKSEKVTFGVRFSYPTGVGNAQNLFKKWLKCFSKKNYFTKIGIRLQHFMVICSKSRLTSS